MYVNLDEESNGITWHNESESCLFTIYPAVGQSGNARQEDSGAIRDGAVVCLFAPNGYFLSFDGQRHAANRPYYVAGPSAEFIVQVPGDGELRNNGKLILRNRASLCMLEVGTQDAVEAVQEDCTANTERTANGDVAKNAAVVDHAEDGYFQVQKILQKKTDAHITPRKRRVSSVKWRCRLLVPKLPQYARRFSQDCSYMSKPSPRKFMLRSAMSQVAISAR
jgi:hypothetical protein